MKTQGLSPSQLPGALSGPGEPGWKDRVAGLLDKECSWVLSLSEKLGRTSYTEMIFKLYRFIATGVDENGFWREFVIGYGRVEPQQLDSFMNEFEELKAESVKRVAAACRKVYNTPLARASDLPARLPAHLARMTVGAALENGVKGRHIDVENVKHIIDFGWVYTIVSREIEMLGTLMGMTSRQINVMIACLDDCR